MSAQSALTWSVESIKEKLTEFVSEATQIPIDEISPDLPLASYGLDSVNAIAMTGELENWFDIELEPTLAWDYPTIDAITEYLYDLVGEEAGLEPATDLAV